MSKVCWLAARRMGRALLVAIPSTSLKAGRYLSFVAISRVHKQYFEMFDRDPS